MEGPDFEQAWHYAQQRLEHELSPSLTYHSVWHTQSDVVPAVQRLATLEDLDDESTLLLVTAAWYHDMGFIYQQAGHEAIGVQIATENLPGFGYTAAQIEIISGLIMATKLPQSPQTHLEELMADADLDNLGREDFLPVAHKLRTEQETFGVVQTDDEWYRMEIGFLEDHTYFTETAHQLRNAGKQANIETLYELMQNSRK